MKFQIYRPINLQILKRGFTLIELLVTISIIAVLIGLSIFGLQGARESARDSKRKADLESIRSAIEIYKSDCDKYPVETGPAGTVLVTTGTSLMGDGSTPSCATSNVYMTSIPSDPAYPGRDYIYYSPDGSVYLLCASLEQSGIANLTCGSYSTCGSTSCNYKVANP